MNPKVDNYLIDGCGRCSLGGTPQCKVKRWTKELKILRQIVLDCGLLEELKWGVPCYTLNKKNILIVSAFKEYCAISFFKGALLNDTQEILHQPGENSLASRIIMVTQEQQIVELESILKTYIFEAIEVEKAGLTIKSKPVSEYHVPEEFQKKFNETPALKSAFDALTPGRQKAYLVHFSQPKQSKTRASRIEKYVPHILDGKGLNDY